MSTTGHFPKRKVKEVQQATLCFLVRGRGASKEVCLAMKRRGFGQGLWNGAGGKVKDGETPRQASLRETFEELMVRPKRIKKVALLHFYFPDEPRSRDWNQDVHVFLANKWDGEPQRTEEMAPRWFGFKAIPFEKMWADDTFWLKRVLAGEKIEGWFYFDGGNRVADWRVKNVAKSGRFSQKR